MEEKREKQFNERLKTLKERIEELEIRKRVQSVAFEELNTYSEIIKEVIKEKEKSESRYETIYRILSVTTQFNDIPWEIKASAFTNEELTRIERGYQGIIALKSLAGTIRYLEGSPYSELRHIDFEKLERSIKNALEII